MQMFRSLLFFPLSGDGLQHFAGHLATDAYLEEGEGRLVQSLKSHLASTTFKTTQVMEKRYSIHDLLVLILRDLRTAAEASLGPLGTSVVVGRPYRYSGEGSSTYSEQLALDRTRAAFRAAGFDALEFEYEPVAAALDYEQTLDHDEVVLVADFGGGTSDFSVVRVGPSCRTLERSETVLSTEGVAIAGDTFDSRIVKEIIAPRFGSDSTFLGMTGMELNVPSWLYGHLEKWHLLSFLKERRTMNLLHKISASSREAAKIRGLITLVRENLGFHLFRSVEATKIALSTQPHARLLFNECGVKVDVSIQRGDFERWIAPDLHTIGQAVDRALNGAGVDHREIDRVFMTGGTSRMPAVRAVFEQRFAPERIVTGSQFTSVATGLAIAAARRSP